jgi:hypothetical protein
MDKVQLDDLPESSNKEFWGEAEINTNLTPQKMFDETHTFRRVSGHEAYCDHCGWGFALDPGDKIKDGHLYTKEEKLVI